MTASARGAAELRRESELARREPAPQRFRVVILPGNPDRVELTTRSLDKQTWVHWRGHRLSGAAAGVAGLNRAVIAEERPTRDLVLLVREGDILPPECLYELAAAVHRDPIVDLLTWDDDVIAPEGAPLDRRVRPSWSPDILFSSGYLGRACAVRHDRIAACGGFDESLPLDPEALWWDIALRGGFEEDRTARIPRVLLHLGARTEPHAAVGRDIVARAVRERNMAAEAGFAGGAVRLRWTVAAPPRVSIVIPTRHDRRRLATLFEGLRETDYPQFDVVVVDNGGRNAEKERWYAGWRDSGLSLTVLWWDRPFNYSAVNNLGARRSEGELLAFLNDDVEVLDPAWLRQLCGWIDVPGVGLVGMQLLGSDGCIQHGGVIVGLNGFADHLFAGVTPTSDTLLGSTAWYRDCLAVTGACVAIRRSLFEEIGGFDERMALCGSDVTLGIEARLRGHRTLCIPDHGLLHRESTTRGRSPIPEDDFHFSYWKYQPWLHGGDPYWSPALSMVSTDPQLRDMQEPRSLDMIAPVIRRTFSVFRAGEDLLAARHVAAYCRATPDDIAELAVLHARNRDPLAVRSVNWVIPGIDSPFYGGINTALRLADHLARHHGVDNRLVVTGQGPERFIRSGITTAFPALAHTPIHICGADGIEGAPAADAAIATLWTTAYDVLRVRNVRRKFYLVQDYEPMFYPAGTMYALAEESYRFGLYGLCNTHNLAAIYRGYGGTGTSFVPAIDPAIFHARGRGRWQPDDPVTIFVYARPNHFRNCWELAEPALVELKERLGDAVRIVAAGSWDIPDPPGHLPAIDYRGLIEYRSTGRLYRSADIGLALTVSEHPSYLPLELMACGAAVVAFDNPAGHWLLRDNHNSILSRRTVDCLVDALERLSVNPPLRRRLTANALDEIARYHSSWAQAFAHIYEFLCDPQGQAAAAAPESPWGTHRLDLGRLDGRRSSA